MNVKPLSTIDEINKNYKILVKKHHPDINNENNKIVEVNKAYEILKNYIKKYRFTFSEEEIKRQYPNETLRIDK